MNASVYKSEQGRTIVEQVYQNHLNSALADGLLQRTIETACGSTFIIEKTSPQKPPLILLHGSTSNSASWLGILPLFTQDFSVYCVDIPGEPGFSTPKRFSLASDTPEAWLRSTLDVLGLQKCSFLGMSLGGWYAVNFAFRNPERVQALSLVSGGGIAAQKLGFIFKALFFLMLGKTGQHMLSKVIYHHTVVPHEILDYQAIVSKYFNPVTEPLPVFSDEQLLRLTMPIQYFGGDHDALLNTRKSIERLKALLPHAQAHLLVDTGHAIIDKFGEIKEFLIRSQV